MTIENVNALIEKAERLDDAALKELHTRTKKLILDGKTFDKMDATECLMFCHSVGRMLQDRANGMAAHKQEHVDVATRLAHDVGISIEDARTYIQNRGNPYQRPRQGVREAALTAADFDAHDPQFTQQPEPPKEREVVRRRYSWGE